MLLPLGNSKNRPGVIHVERGINVRCAKKIAGTVHQKAAIRGDSLIKNLPPNANSVVIVSVALTRSKVVPALAGPCVLVVP